MATADEYVFPENVLLVSARPKQLPRVGQLWRHRGGWLVSIAKVWTSGTGIDGLPLVHIRTGAGTYSLVNFLWEHTPILEPVAVYRGGRRVS